MSRLLAALLVLLLTAFAQKPNAAAHPRDKAIKDPDTRAWWHLTETLSGDDMEGRDVGSAAYDRAAQLVADHFKAAGLTPAGDPAGDKATFFQEVPMHDVQVMPDGTSFVLLRQLDGKGEIQQPYKFLHQITIRASDDLPATFEGELVFAGYCAPKQFSALPPDAADPASAKDKPSVFGKIVLCFATHDRKLVEPAQRTQALRDAGAKAVILVDDPSWLEPPRWPVPYARTVTSVDPNALAPRASRPSRAGGNAANRPPNLPTLTLNNAAFAEFIDASGKDGRAILAKATRGEPLESFAVNAKMRVTLNVKSRNYSSRNVVAVREGTDSKLKDEYVVLTAHLDGYGYGEPVNGDNLYNGALDDAAYVALLEQLADRENNAVPGHDIPLSHTNAGAAGSADAAVNTFKSAPLARSLLFLVTTGEEKGLLGSRWYAAHPTVPKDKLAAVINLDQLRPLFPLTILTTLALDQSTLGDDVKAVAKPMGIEVRPDLEPERSLLMRTDHWPFMQIGVPAVSFVFGYDKGTDAEKKYREWYEVRYHRPQDDLAQPIDFDAATKFNQFFYRLVAKVANDLERPKWLVPPPIPRSAAP